MDKGRMTNYSTGKMGERESGQHSDCLLMLERRLRKAPKDAYKEKGRRPDRLGDLLIAIDRFLKK